MQGKRGRVRCVDMSCYMPTDGTVLGLGHSVRVRVAVGRLRCILVVVWFHLQMYRYTSDAYGSSHRTTSTKAPAKRMSWLMLFASSTLISRPPRPIAAETVTRAGKGRSVFATVATLSKFQSRRR